MKKLIISIIVGCAIGAFAANYTPVSQESGNAAVAITTLTVGSSLVLTNTGTVKMSGVTCATSNLVVIADGVTNTLVIVDGLITAIQ